ncbi:MAG: hypothetical protein RL329_3922 [Bacteroidota bacterium]|jgi:hypothetical protein
MNLFASFTDLLSILYQGRDLLAKMFGDRKAHAFPYETALKVVREQEHIINKLLGKNIILKNGSNLIINDAYLTFFEQIFEVNEEVNTSYIHEKIDKINRDIKAYLVAQTQVSRMKYLKEVKSTLQVVEKVIFKSIVDLNRNIQDVFQTEPNYKIKVLKLKHYDEKLTDLRQLIHQTRQLIDTHEILFFKTVIDPDFRKLAILTSLNDSSHDLIATQEQIILYLNQYKSRSLFIDKLQQIKYLKDQHELEDTKRTNFQDILSRNTDVWFETHPPISFKLSPTQLEAEGSYKMIQKVHVLMKSAPKRLSKSAGNLSKSELETESELTDHINLVEINNAFKAAGNHLFDFILNYRFHRTLDLGEQVTIFCQMIALFDAEYVFDEKEKIYENIEYVVVYPK